MAASTPTLAAPRSPRRARRPNTELYSWVFMRASGALLLILIFVHLFTNLVSGGGVSAIDFGFVAGKWAKPVWQVWDLLILWLAMIHGANGLRTIINDYATRTGTRLTLMGLLAVAFAVVVVLGTLVIFTFSPCPPGAPADLLPSFCTAG
ncbi:succinate dehydrogenase hydrophobic membrane anchor subunit [Isoptericola sp. b441]|uniref:Succinate dehydrogenase hydrophobic membrane anchor subunit n=1 Tax=Actinotalea lenta TaxID=3064654 RepID=A0ABT9DC78_9CELL|nr:MULTISPECIES: succinate dehydrogenase hydrophobic membrane anchor subunit [unclassified Isoptericola]MDO8106901.1 succinate dehydrogenase hydrophobic membrane anchor subunit [Isoptericola sp. b441]MDO8121388.1 succinate dehydrogenase hydrophobic membrane anchor subunit [Isoptericola sp. b490]